MIKQLFEVFSVILVLVEYFSKRKNLQIENGLRVCTVKMYYTKPVAKKIGEPMVTTLFFLKILLGVVIKLSTFLVS